MEDDKYRCAKTYLRPDTDNPETTEIFIRTRVPHDCWRTGKDYCKRGTKIIDVPPVERRVQLKIVHNKYTERWQPWNPAWSKKYLDAIELPTCKNCNTCLFNCGDCLNGQEYADCVNDQCVDDYSCTRISSKCDSKVLRINGRDVKCYWKPAPGEIFTEEYENQLQKFYILWKDECQEACSVDFSFLKAPMRFRVPEIEMTYDGSQSTRFGLDGIIHDSTIELNGEKNNAHMESRVKLYASLEEAFTSVFNAHGIASAVDAVSDSDVLVLQSRCDIEVTKPSDMVSAERALYTLPMGPMPCSEPFKCTFMHWRSREVKVNVMRRKCTRIMYDRSLGKL